MWLTLGAERALAIETDEDEGWPLPESALLLNADAYRNVIGKYGVWTVSRPFQAFPRSRP